MQNLYQKTEIKNQSVAAAAIAHRHHHHHHDDDNDVAADHEVKWLKVYSNNIHNPLLLVTINVRKIKKAIKAYPLFSHIYAPLSYFIK